MIIIPTADLRGSSLYPPLGGTSKPSGPIDPSDAHRVFSGLGFRRMHFHDLDADRNTDPNDALIEEFAREGSLDLVVSGARMPEERVERLLEAGVDQILIEPGVRDIDDLGRLADAFPESLVIRADGSADAAGRRAGSRRKELDTIDLVTELGSLPIAGVAVDVLSSDGFPGNPLRLVEELVEISAVPVFCRTEASSIGELRALEDIGVAAVLLGISLYSGALDARAVAQHFDA